MSLGQRAGGDTISPITSHQRPNSRVNHFFTMEILFIHSKKIFGFLYVSGMSCEHKSMKSLIQLLHVNFCEHQNLMLEEILGVTFHSPTVNCS